MEKLMTFSDQGGIIVAWGRSAGLFEGIMEIKQGEETESFQLPFQPAGDAMVPCDFLFLYSLL